ncbi:MULTISPECIES: hypothetical protein [Aeromicrobium]|uniref:hypothetical protein n=1 Tax=Aeromicrobium TaxID=2040 RepID=UPI0006F523DE|nr:MULTISPECIES: hypothetical protein [Aeromicrobium]KQX72299.1 hypothetical protein ASD10_14955 [Aeromicrobium sp. Root472D3]MCL8250977.1 hypothetical protein [Aeromicrobium fastidiosum]
MNPTAAEVTALLPGDDVVPDANVVMDRAFGLDAPPEQVWPWFVQLGKQRAGWYLPRWVERFVPPDRRAYRRIEPGLQDLAVGDVIADWGGPDATFEVAVLEPPSTLVHVSTRGSVRLSWAIRVTADGPGTSRVHLRLRLGGVRRERLARVGGGFVDWLTLVGLAAGLRERVRQT